MATWTGTVKEQYRIRWAKHQLCRCITLSFLSFFFYISWPRCTTTTWKFLIKRFIEGVIKTKRFFLKLDIVHRRQINDTAELVNSRSLLTLNINVLCLWCITTLIASFTYVVPSFTPVDIDELWHTTIKALTSADPHPWHDWPRSTRCITRQIQVTTFSYCLVLQRLDDWWHWGEKWKWK